VKLRRKVIYLIIVSGAIITLKKLFVVLYISILNYILSMANSGLGKMHLDLYTQNSGLTHKAKFWCNYVSALKGSQDLRAPDQTIYRTIHPSIVETLPDTFPELKHEFSKLESQMFDKPKRPGLTPLTPVLPDAHDRIFSPGYVYNPVHTEIYGTYRSLAQRGLM